MRRPGRLITPFHLIEAAIALAILGLGTDYARAWVAGVRLQAATDEASLAALTAGTESRRDKAELEQIARNAIAAGLRTRGDVAHLTIRQITVRHTATLPSVSVVVEGTVPTLLLSFAGYENLRVTARSVARFREMPTR